MTKPRFWRKLLNPLNQGGLGWLLFAVLLATVFIFLRLQGDLNWPWWAITSPLWLFAIFISLAAFWPEPK